jgi:hypothetical protein
LQNEQGKLMKSSDSAAAQRPGEGDRGAMTFSLYSYHAATSTTMIDCFG